MHREMISTNVMRVNCANRDCEYMVKSGVGEKESSVDLMAEKCDRNYTFDLNKSF